MAGRITAIRVQKHNDKRANVFIDDEFAFGLDLIEAAKLSKGQYLRGRCYEMASELCAKFPELTLTRGHYLCTEWGSQEHWWVVAPNGEIIDPTAGQFPSQGHGTYVPWDESQPEPTGKCPVCGRYTYNRDYTCPDTCTQEYELYLKEGI